MKSAFENAYEKYLKQLLVVTLSFITAHYLTDSIKVSTNAYCGTSIGRHWLRAAVLALFTVSVMFLVCFLDPVDDIDVVS